MRLPARGLVALVLVVAAVVGVVALAANRIEDPALQVEIARLPATVASIEQVDRDLDPYAGYGTWVDVFDYAPAYQDGGEPAVSPADLDAMADRGVRTLFLQAARNDARSPDRLVDEALLAEFLFRAHTRGMRVVGWYLPRFADVDHDLALLQEIRDFEALGHRFDGVAVDIEFTEDVPAPDERNDRLIELSERFREESDDEALGAIVLPPVLLEVVNPDFWPDFPWEELERHYDVWLPMSYWTLRREDSGYRDGYTYNGESTERLRDNLGNSRAVVHGIGGIGDEAAPLDLAAFAESLADTRSVGGSIYDWSTLTDEGRRAIEAAFDQGAAADLPEP